MKDTKFKLEGADNIHDLYSNICQYFSNTLKEIDQDERAFIRYDISELIGELEGLSQRVED